VVARNVTLGRGIYPVVAVLNPTNGKGYMATLFHSVDNNSTKSDKHVEHGTAIVKLVSAAVRRALVALAQEDSPE